jgi:hypothetical protein
VNGSPGTGDSGGFAYHYDGWRWDHFAANEIYLPSPPSPSGTANSALVGPGADPDGDGLNNAGEYAYCRNPRLSDNDGLATPGLLTIGADTFLTATFTRRRQALDVTYTVEVSDTLTGGWTQATTQVGSAVDLGNGAEQVVYRDNIPQGAAPRFIRARAVKP